MEKMPKLFKADTIGKLLGEKALERLRVAYLRGKALGVKPVSLEDVKLARKYVEAPQGGLKAASAFKRVTFKWVSESKWAHRAFLRYTDALIGTHEKVTAKPREVKRRAKAKKV